MKEDKKEHEKRGIDCLLKQFPDYQIIDDDRESPDFLIGNSMVKIGVEVTDYFPHHNRKGGVVFQYDKNSAGINKHRLFTETELGFFRFVPEIKIDDLCSFSISKKEQKLVKYRENVQCDEFWLLVMLNFYDNVSYGWQDLSIKTTFDKVFLWEELDDITEIKALK